MQTTSLCVALDQAAIMPRPGVRRSEGTAGYGLAMLQSSEWIRVRLAQWSFAGLDRSNVFFEQPFPQWSGSNRR
ncbi:MAG: hypothetical protein MI923_07740 [Phycisphaerales bacterium]|nr:hypothetical protein [Phycisphaerales bacterium]